MALCFGPSRAEATDYFFHIPRTGGNYTIRVILRLELGGKPAFKEHRGHGHGPPDTIPQPIGRSFTIVRPPLDWYRSFYRFRIGKHYVGKNMAPSHPLDKYIWTGQHQRGGHIYPFNSFVACVQADYPEGYLTGLFGRFIRGVDEVLSTDELSTQLPALLAKWGYDEPIWLPRNRKNATVDDHGRWVRPSKFNRWVSRGHNVAELLMDIEPATLQRLEECEHKIITRLRRMI